VCLFCGRDEDNELLYGKIYELDDIVTHYYCLVRCIMFLIFNFNWLLLYSEDDNMQSRKMWL
jgi:hypothetical protein